MKKMWNLARLSVLVLPLLVATSVLAADPSVIEDGVLDWIELHGALPAGAAIVIEPFDTADADLGTGAEGGKQKRVDIALQMQEQAPDLLAASLVDALKEAGFMDVRSSDGTAAAPGSVVVRGAFTMLDPGSKAKRYWAGFGAGKGSIEVEGRVESAEGEILARFRQKRLTVMGIAGGDYEKKMSSDCRSIGEDIARFLGKWSAGKPLKG